jgi:glycosyltransferase involved in cell wall biosynthesis
VDLEAFRDLGLSVDVITTEEDGPADDTFDFVDDLVVLEAKLFFGWSRELVSRTKHLSSRADAVVIASAMLLPAVLASRPIAPIVWDTNECETLHYRRLPKGIRSIAGGTAWRVLESWAARACDHVIAISEVEQQSWARLFPAVQSKISTVVHRPLWREVSPSEARVAISEFRGPSTTGPVALFVGNLVAKHNRAAAEWLRSELTPLLPPGSTLLLVGPGTEAFSRISTRGAECIGVGPIEEVDAVIAGSDLCLAPLAAGAGVKTKVLHYLAHGKRVAGTPTAFEGLERAPGLTAAVLGDLAEIVVEILRSPEAAEAARRRASEQREWLEAHHGRERVAAQWSTVFRKVGIDLEVLDQTLPEP